MNHYKDRLLQLAEMLGGYHLARFWSRRQPRILMYHRIIDHPQINAITPAEFELQLAYLKENFNVIPVEELINARLNRTPQNNAVAITFDDGHSDFYQNAWPLLKKYNLPASLYITTGFIDNQCWLWPDLLRHIIWSTEKASIEDAHGTVLSLDPAVKPATWNTIASHCLKLPSRERISYIKTIAEKLNVDTETPPCAPFNPVTWDNLNEMHKEGLDIGSHTVSHRILSSLQPQELTTELSTSKLRIEQEVGIGVSGICYPNGMTEDINQTVENEARQQGYRYGLCAYPARNKLGNPFHQGRWAAPKSYCLFKRMVNGISRDGNPDGKHV